MLIVSACNGVVFFSACAFTYMKGIQQGEHAAHILLGVYVMTLNLTLQMALAYV
jgi:hypothetical protein